MSLLPKREILVMLSLSELRIELNPRYRESIMMAEAVVYLLSTAGLDLGYSFQWFRGVGSRDVANSLIHISDTLHFNYVEACRWSLGDDVKEKLRRVAALLVPPVDFSSDRVEWALLLSRLAYLSEDQRDVLIREPMVKYAQRVLDDNKRLCERRDIELGMEALEQLRQLRG